MKGEIDRQKGVFHGFAGGDGMDGRAVSSAGYPCVDCDSDADHRCFDQNAAQGLEKLQDGGVGFRGDVRRNFGGLF